MAAQKLNDSTVHSICLIEISQLAKLSSQVNLSVGTNMFINGKLDKKIKKIKKLRNLQMVY